MYRVQRMVLDKERDRDVLGYADTVSELSRALYNASLFRIRQVFTGWDKEKLTVNEQKIFDELKILKKAYPGKNVRRVLSYTTLEKLMRATNNPDFFAKGLSMQASQNCVRQAVHDFEAWIAAIGAWKKDPSAFTGKPNMPGYKKPGTKMTMTFTNQDCVLKENESGYSMKLPLTKVSWQHAWGKKALPGRFMEMKLIPFYDTWVMALTFEADIVENDADLPCMAGMDLGVRNTVAMALNGSHGLICRGGVLNSEIRLYCKEKARLESCMDKQFGKHVDTKAYVRLEKLHSCRMTDMLHKLSRFVVDTCLRYQVGILVIGHTKYWKQESRMGKNNNQLFEMIPFERLRNMIVYKAEAAGIIVLEQEESYTSKSDFLMDDPIPVYGQTEKEPAFSGKRCRGLYKSGSGAVINADMNGAANILRKAYPDAFKNTEDFSFLSSPEVVDMKHVYKCTPVKRIGAAVNRAPGPAQEKKPLPSSARWR